MSRLDREAWLGRRVEAVRRVGVSKRSDGYMCAVTERIEDAGPAGGPHGMISLQHVSKRFPGSGLDPELRDRYPAELSGGQRQRVGVARALAADPPVMLMDEPFAAVDPIVRARLQDQFLDIQRRLRKTIVFVTHDIDEAIKMADRITIMNIGGIIEQFGPPEEILREPASKFVEDFVGAERGLKRLALIKVSEIDVEQ